MRGRRRRGRREGDAEFPAVVLQREGRVGRVRRRVRGRVQWVPRSGGVFDDEVNGRVAAWEGAEEEAVVLWFAEQEEPAVAVAAGVGGRMPVRCEEECLLDAWGAEDGVPEVAAGALAEEEVLGREEDEDGFEEFFGEVGGVGGCFRLRHSRALRRCFFHVDILFVVDSRVLLFEMQALEAAAAAADEPIHWISYYIREAGEVEMEEHTGLTWHWALSAIQWMNGSRRPIPSDVSRHAHAHAWGNCGGACAVALELSREDPWYWEALRIPDGGRGGISIILLCYAI